MPDSYSDVSEETADSIGPEYESDSDKENVPPHGHLVRRVINGRPVLVPCTNSRCNILREWLIRRAQENQRRSN